MHGSQGLQVRSMSATCGDTASSEQVKLLSMTFAWHLSWLRPHLSEGVITSADQYTSHVTYIIEAWSATQAMQCKTGASDEMHRTLRRRMLLLW